MSERKLASVQKVLKVEPIEGADLIVKVTVLGWELVCKKDEVKEGDIGVYIEIDSIVPKTDMFEFLEKRNYRIRTIKLKGQVSQGLFLPISILPSDKSYKEGDDVTEILGITKYLTESERLEDEQDIELEKESPNRIDKYLRNFRFYRKISAPFRKKKVSGVFPSFIKKTDEPRIQWFPNFCENYKGVKFTKTEKLDGQSFTAFVKNYDNNRFKFWKKHDFGVCSRNKRLVHKNNSSWWNVAEKYCIEDILIDLCEEYGKAGMFIQGEIIGPRIQGNKYKLSEYQLYIFNIGFNDTKERLSQETVNDLCSKYNLTPVPTLSLDYYLKDTIPMCVEEAKGFSVINKKTIREGLVIRNYEKGISFKIINPDFLLDKNAE